MKPTEAMLSPVFPKGIHWAHHGGSHGKGHHPRSYTIEDSILPVPEPCTKASLTCHPVTSIELIDLY